MGSFFVSIVSDFIENINTNTVATIIVIIAECFKINI
jgi:hypothetical protein